MAIMLVIGKVSDRILTRIKIDFKEPIDRVQTENLSALEALEDEIRGKKTTTEVTSKAEDRRNLERTNRDLSSQLRKKWRISAMREVIVVVFNEESWLKHDFDNSHWRMLIPKTAQLYIAYRHKFEVAS